MKDRIFERFVREEQAGSEGTGLGLAIVRGIVEAHAGRVWLDDPDAAAGRCSPSRSRPAPPEPAEVEPAATKPVTAT